MDDLRSLLPERQLNKLRSAYRSDDLMAANITGMGQAYPPIAAWNQEIGATFYRADSPLTPANRERCLITLLTYTGPPISLAVHSYWGLMEGLSVDEMCQMAALAGCYGGLPKCVQGLLVLERVLKLLDRAADGVDPTAAGMLAAIVQEFQRT